MQYPGAGLQMVLPLLQIQQILDFEIVSKKDIDNFMNKFYLETINEVKR